jgi:hypothetical protein
VVEIDNTETGEQLYYRDTRRQWTRVILSSFDALAIVFTFVLCFRLRSKPGDEKDQGSAALADDDEMPDEPITLGPGAGDNKTS